MLMLKQTHSTVQHEHKAKQHAIQSGEQLHQCMCATALDGDAAKVLIALVSVSISTQDSCLSMRALRQYCW